MDIGMEIVSSSMMRAIGYDKESQTVAVQFKNGDVWNYFDVPQDVFDFVRNAPSIGHAFVQQIREVYEGKPA